MCSYYLPAKIMSITFCVQHHANLSVFTLLLLLIVDISLRPWYIAIQGYRLLPMTVCNKEGWEWGYEYLLWPACTAPTSLFRSVDCMLQHSAHHINTVIIRWLQQLNSWLTGCCHHCNICVLLREKKLNPQNGIKRVGGAPVKWEGSRWGSMRWERKRGTAVK